MAGLVDALPRRGWFAILACVAVAAGSLLIPPSVATDRGVSFAAFFFGVTALQGAAALGIVAVLWHYRGLDPDERGGDEADGEWRFDP
jgi:hypothetical protein